MKISTTEFYAKHYREIGDLLNLEKEVCDTYPQELGDLVQDAMEDRLATEFAGKEEWGGSSYGAYGGWLEVSWWHKSFDDDLYFGIANLREAVSHERSVKGLIHCYLGTEEAKRATKIRLQKQRSHISRLRKLGYEVSEGNKNDWWFARVAVGDLLHISTFNERKRNFERLIERAERFVRACLPLIPTET